jgi:hypothetical protein
MVNAQVPDRPSQVRARQITASDRDAVAALLRKGFGFRRTQAFWQQVINRLEAHLVPDGMPQFGYLLESDGRVVGAILAIFSIPRTGADPDAVRCSISSWYVEPAFRSYASLLASQVLKHRNATYSILRRREHHADRGRPGLYATATDCSSPAPLRAAPRTHAALRRGKPRGPFDCSSPACATTPAMAA